MLDKRFKKFYELENNRYYVLSEDNELYLMTESLYQVPRKFFKTPKKITQGLKGLQLSPSISMLFEAIVGENVIEEDKDFDDMTKYEKIDNTELRKRIDETYNIALNQRIEELNDEFDNWKENFAEKYKNLGEKVIQDTIDLQTKRHDELVESFKKNSPYMNLSFKKPTASKDSSVVVKMLNEDNLEFLYSQKLGSNIKIYYLYDLDVFGTLTMYKVLTVKGTVKSIDSFVYNIKILRELISYIINNNL